MGNFVDTTYLEKPVSPNLLFLTRCNYYLGSPSEITKLFKNYSSFQESGNFYYLQNQIRAISYETL